ncbi:hypothetical protein LCGC14_2794250, partial [marine sediment metagenome]
EGKEYYHNNPYTLKIENGKDDIDYNSGDVVEPGTYIIRLDGKVPNIWTTVDWQIRSNGHWLDEWAIWTSGLTVDLLSYYNMTNISSTDILDLQGSSDIDILRNGGAVPVILPGIIGDSQGNFTDVNTQLNLTDTAFRFLNRNYSMMVWANLGGTCANFGNQHNFFGGGRTILGFQNQASGVCQWFIGLDSSPVTNTTGINLLDSQWHQLVFNVNNAGDIDMYFDGVLNTTKTTAFSGDVRTNVTNFRTNSANNAPNYRFDEVGIWNRTLSSAEITQLYNGGAGLPFDPDATAVVLITPTDNAFNLSGQTNFNATITVPSNLKIDNATLYIWNSTNLINFTTNFTIEAGNVFVNSYLLSANLPIADTYTWNYFACSNSTTSDPCSWAEENRTFTISIVAEDTFTFEPFVTET